MPARIVVDLLGFTGGRGGTETYARELLARLPDLLPEIEWVALANRRGAEQVRSFFPGQVCVLSWVGADRVTWALGAVFAVAPAVRKAGANGVWCPANFGPLVRGPRRVVTIHDAIYHAPGSTWSARLIGAATSWLMTRSARTADRVITVSQSAARSIAQHMHIDLTEIAVIPNGSGEPQAPADPWLLLDSLDLDRGRPIVLTAGNRLAHKNLPGLLRALREIPSAERPLLVVTGGGTDDPLLREIEALELSADVVLPGWVTPGQLEALYAVAHLYVCPSLQEGFGLPVVDALRRGVPVVANDIAVLREVGGTFARYADATNPQSLARAMTAEMKMPVGQGDRSARATWAVQFSWDTAAASLASHLRRTLVTEPDTARRITGTESS